MKVAVIDNKDYTGVINVFGMQTRERYNPKTVEKVASALEKGGHNVRIIDGNMHVIDKLKDFMPRVISGELPGMVFNMAYGIQGQSRYSHIPAMLEMLGVPYVGSNPSAHALALDKVISKMIFQQHNLPTPHYWVFSTVDEIPDSLPYPLIAKPKMEAVSYGLCVIYNKDQLCESVKYITSEFKQQALVEKFIPGREFAVGLLGNNDPEIFPIVEIDLEGDPYAIQTVEDKTEKVRRKICPVKISSETEKKLKDLAVLAFRVLGICDFARVDFRMDEQENIYILELNSMASLGLTGSYVHAAKVAGYTYETLVNRILDIAAVRSFGKSYIMGVPEEEIQTNKKRPLSVRVRSYLRGHIITLEDYLKKIVEMNSYFQNIEGVNLLGNLISNKLSTLGFNRKVYPQTEVGNILYFSNHIEEKNDILILSHLDTRYTQQDFISFKEERGRIYGSGVAESKGGLVVMQGALQSLKFSRVLKNIRCGVLLTTDDGLGGRFSRQIIEEISSKSKYVVGLKYGDIDGGIVTSCSGTRLYNIEATNIKDSGLEEAPDVVAILSKKLLTWKKLSSLEDGILVNARVFEAYRRYGFAPDHGKILLTVRFKEASQRADLDKEIKQIASKSISTNIRIHITRTFSRPPVMEVKEIIEFFEKVKTIAKKLEIQIKPIHRFYSSNIGYVPQRIPVLDGLGPVGGDCRTANEFIIRDSIIDKAALLAILIYECSKKQ